VETPSVQVRGIVKPGGVLEVTEQVPLPPGPVQVVIQRLPVKAEPAESWWQCLQRGRAELEAKGAFRTQEEIEAERESFRAERQDREPGSC
jgi:hypothetical protein